MRIEVGKFERYGKKLKQMSADGIIIDIIQDDDDTRDTYFIDGDPDQIRSYLMHGIRKVLNRYSSAERAKIRELESRLREMEAVVQEKNHLLNIRDLLCQGLDRKSKEH